MRRAGTAIIVALALLLAAPAAALAQGNPFTPPPIDPNAPVAQPTPTPTASPTSSGLGSTARTTLYVIGAGLLVVFVGIGVWIARDARRALPETRRHQPAAAGPSGTARRHTPEAKQRARARTKAQRRARRHNR